MAKKKNERETVRVTCGIDGFKDNWIEYDVTDWGVYEFRTLPETDQGDILVEWLEPYCSNWNIAKRGGGLVEFPGKDAEEDAWLEAYKQVAGGMPLARWLIWSSFFALGLAYSPRPKSDEGNEASGDESE